MIPPPSAVLTMACPAPAELPDMATARELADTLMEWIQFGACERGRRVALLRSWPQ
ncbi:hypothetical protein [Ramlibacter sp.]|uniref:hypothetical protein n=1 Tax=Ramlibacter sp. TaxID=1917967 RepID=UPI003D143771